MRELQAEYHNLDMSAPLITLEGGGWGSAVTDTLARLRSATEEFRHIEEDGDRSAEDVLHATAAALHRFARAAGACERAGLTREDLLPHLVGLRALHAQSPLVSRLQTWPRGYPGDFETIEWLCDAKNRARADVPVPWAIEQCALQSPVAQQHRNKVELQARAILSTVLADPAARVASIGCGGCRDLSLIQDYLPPTHGTFVLVDADGEALEFASQRLPRLAGRCHFIKGRVPRALSRLRGMGGFDLIVAGGLFDYLPDPWAVSTLSIMRDLLRPDGRIFFSNIAKGNPFRLWIEYLADWRLIERDESDLRRFMVEAGFRDGSVEVLHDNTQLALMVEGRR